jgi:MSHA biogenesis protein MshP
MRAARQIWRPQAEGFALMMAIFIIVTLAAIGLYLLTVSTGQIEAATQDEQGTRAYQAARTGVEWGAYQLLQNPAGPLATACAPGPTTRDLPPLANGFNVRVRCERVGSEVEAGVPVAAYSLTVTGCNNAPCDGTSTAPTYVERQLQLTLTR